MLAQKSCTYICMGYTYICMGGTPSSFRRLTYKYCVLDPSKTSFSQVLSILHTLLSLIFCRDHRNTVDCAEHVYIHLHSNCTYISTGTAAVHTFLHTNKNPDLPRLMTKQACIHVYCILCTGMTELTCTAHFHSPTVHARDTMHTGVGAAGGQAAASLRARTACA